MLPSDRDEALAAAMALVTAMRARVTDPGEVLASYLSQDPRKDANSLFMVCVVLASWYSAVIDYVETDPDALLQALALIDYDDLGDGVDG